MNHKYHGHCLCGQVQYEVRGPFEAFHACHCSQCRRSTGSAHASNIFTRANHITWIAGENWIKRYTPDKPGVISKCFCLHCGSLVPYTSLTSGKLIIPAGSLDEDPGFAVEDNIYWSDRAPWYDSLLQAEHVDQEPIKRDP